MDPFSIEALESGDITDIENLLGNDEEHKAQEKSNSLIQVLEVQRNDIKFSEMTVINLNQVLRFGNLMVLDLSYNHLGDMGIEQLSVGLVGKIALKKLHMIDCKFGQAGADEFFNNISINSSIIELKIDKNYLGEVKNF